MPENRMSKVQNDRPLRSGGSQVAVTVGGRLGPRSRRRAVAGIAVTCLGFLLALATPAWPQVTFTTFDAPGAGTTSLLGTFATSVNSAGEIAGTYTYGNNVARGFVRAANGTVTLIDAPDAGTGTHQGTFAISINTEGDVAGMYYGTNYAVHGFVRTAATGTITEFDVPGAPTSVLDRGTQPLSIDTAGDITGIYLDTSDVRHGFVRAANGTFITFNVAGAGTAATQGTFPLSINTVGVVTGFYADSNGTFHGFVRAANGTITAPIDAPGASTGAANGFSFKGTIPASIDEAGDVTGAYTDTNGVFHGFVRAANGTMTAPIDVTGSGTGGLFPGTIPFSISTAGEITGLYEDSSGVFHGFVRTAGGTITAPIDVPAAGTNALEGTAVASIDTAGDLTGIYRDANGVFHGFVRSTGSTTAGTTTTVTSISPNPSIDGQAVTLTAEVASSGGTPPNGEPVVFMQSATLLGTGTLSGGSASFVTSLLPVGTYSVTAVYGGDSSFASSASAAASLVVNPAGAQAATPTFSPAPGIYSSAQAVTISDATNGAALYYTTNGTTPTTASTKYAGAITVSDTEIIEVIAVANSYANSTVATATYVITAATLASNEWAWVNGSNVVNQKGTYGTLGTAAAGNAPGARGSAVSWKDAAGNFWLFGGYGYDSAGATGDLNDLWEYSAGQWTWMGGSNVVAQKGTYGTKGTAAAGNVPGARSSAVSWTDTSGNFWLFGGSGYDSTGSGIGYLNDLWKYAGGQWTWMGGSSVANQSGTYGTKGIPAAGNVPGCRFSSASWRDAAGNFWLFGGYGYNSGAVLLNDLWEYIPSTGEWTWMGGSSLANQSGTYGTKGTPAASNVPGARYVAVTWTDTSGNLWLFGGDNSLTTSGALNDLWEYSTSTGEWTWMSGSSLANQPGTYGTRGIPAAGNVPGARYLSVSWTDTFGNFWLFGGYYLNDLWRYSAGQWTWMGGSNGSGQKGTYGTEGTAAAGNVPGARDQSVSWTDASGNLWLFGGDGLDSAATFGYLNDLWEYQPPAPGAALFVPVTPCRIADTRNANGAFGGPALTAESSRSFTVPSSACGIPSSATAYSLNVTVVPGGSLGYISLWPTGQAQPGVSTLNSLDGRIKSDAAIVPAGTGGAVSVFATDATNVILDINGYFVPAAVSGSVAFYPLTPCRVADTRNASGSLGGPSLAGGQIRSFPVLSACSIPSTAQAYSLNFTAIPQGPLGYLSVWPAGQAQPLVSTLNAPTGTVTANAAIVPAGTNGAIDAYVTNNTDLAIDINGYFAPAGPGGLALYTLTPCRVLDTRVSGSQPFSGTLNVNVTGSGCGAPSSAQAYVFNATVVPPSPLGYVTLWPQGATQPLVSTLNALDGSLTSNMAIVPAASGAVSAYASNPTQLILDISGYFAP
jgi:hypothetical protein